ncbi:MAG: glutamine synthetase family protein, partial [Actinomycetota bacterium]
MTLTVDHEFVLRTVDEREIKFVRLLFTDIQGFLKSFTITPAELEEGLEDGMGFDGSSIEGFARIEESDMVARPDSSTFQVLPAQDGRPPTARMFCDISTPDGEPFPGDPRFVLRRTLKRARDMGFNYYVGPALEYFYFKSQKQPEYHDLGSYFDVTPFDTQTELREKTVARLEEMGIPVEYVHHEVAPSQHEMILRYADALTMADSVMTFRSVVKEVAQEEGVYATFMPKPVAGVDGSGMHTHMSLFEDERNSFFDPDDEAMLSKVGRCFVAGLLRHAREICAVTNQWVNSYKRLIPGFEAPVHICWARHNRSALVRVPMTARDQSIRVEARFPDPACNPYLAFSVMLAAGLKGIEENYELPPEADNNIYEMTPAERAAAGIESLPEDLH